MTANDVRAEEGARETLSEVILRARWSVKGCGECSAADLCGRCERIEAEAIRDAVLAHLAQQADGETAKLAQEVADAGRRQYCGANPKGSDATDPAIAALLAHVAAQAARHREAEKRLELFGLTASAEPCKDDRCVNLFAVAMRQKLAEKRADGYGGWDDPEVCPPGKLARMLVEHLAKGDPVDAANFAMMLWHRHERTEPSAAEAEVARLRARVVDKGVEGPYQAIALIPGSASAIHLCISVRPDATRTPMEQRRLETMTLPMIEAVASALNALEQGGPS